MPKVRNVFFRRILASVLTAAMLLTNIRVESFAEAGTSYQSYLDGWKVDAAWSSLSTDYTWDAAVESVRQPKEVITYRIRNADRDFPAGSLQFTVPGIGNVVRGTVQKADRLAVGGDDSEWDYSWDQMADTYTFTNRFAVTQGQSVSGGFELLWTLDARKCEDGYERTESPTFSVEDDTIVMEPLSYTFSSTRDRYRIAMEQSKINGEEYENADQSYIWYDFKTRFDSDYLARGLYKSDYRVTVELPDGTEDGDVIAKQGSKEITLTRDEEGQLSFYPFQGKYGDLSGRYSTHYETMTLGFKKSVLDGKEVTVRGHLDRLYEDESEWVRTATGDNECVDVEKTFTVSSYAFVHQGYIYNHTKYTNGYEKWNHDAPDTYADRLPAAGLYNGKIVEFILSGSANRSYTSAAKSRRRAMSEPALASFDDGIESPEDLGIVDWDDLNWKENGLASEDGTLSGQTYGELHPSDLFAITNGDGTFEELFPGQTASASDAKEADVTESSAGKETQEIQENDASEEAATETSTENETASAEEIQKEDSKEDLKEKKDEAAETSGKASESAEPETTEPEKETRSIPDEILSGLGSLLGKVTDTFRMEALAAQEEELPDATPSEAAETINRSLPGTQAGTHTKPGGNTTGVSAIGENQEYALILGDDKLAVTLTDGSMRALDDDEYDIVYVTVPSSRKDYHYEIFGADSQDTAFDDFVCLAEGNTGTGQTIALPEGVKNVFIRVNGITGSYSYTVRTGVRLHLDWESEKLLPEEEQVNRDGKLVNFSYLRAVYTDADGYEVNDCALAVGNYKQEYAEALAKRDEDVYGEFLMRDYAHVWLRNPVTRLSSIAGIGSVNGTPKDGYTATLSGSGTITSDNQAPITSFSLYIKIPAGMHADPDETGATITGTAKTLDGGADIDLADHASISTTERDGAEYLVCDFDCSDDPLDASGKVSVKVSFPATLSYADYVANGTLYQTESLLMPHDAGLDRIDGTSIRSDAFDLDGNGDTTDLMAYSSSSTTISDDATEWREFVSKYVKSAYSAGFATDTVTRLYNGAESADLKAKSDYSYRLDLGLGSSNAKNILFFDRIEQGADISIAGEGKDTTRHYPSAWQGTFRGVDTTQAEKMGLIPTVYYSVDDSQAFDLSASGWSTEAPEDLSTVKSIAIALDTSAMDDGVLKTKQTVSVSINMRTPSDRTLVGKKAVNQYTAQYDAYGLTGGMEDTYTLPSAQTTVELLDNVGKVILQKVDADNVLKTDPDGTVHHAPLTGARIQVYGPDGKALFADGGKDVNSLGRIVLNNVRAGQYAWEEVKAPAGYKKATGKHTFTIGDIPQTIEMGNSRIPGSITFTKTDADDETKAPLAGAEYALSKADGTRVSVTGQDGGYAYSTSGKESSCVTGTDGTFTITGLPWGSYSLSEIKAPAGYELSSDPVTFTVGKDQYDEATDTIHVTVNQADEEKAASIRMTKTDAENGKVLKDAYYDVAVRKPDGTYRKLYEYLKTNAAGELTVEGLKFGHYRFTEVMPPAGYTLAVNPVETDLDETTAGTVVTISQTDDRKTGSAKLKKSSTDGMPLSGAEFTLYKKAEMKDLGNGTDADTLVKEGLMTGEDGTTGTVEQLTWGTYYFLETKAPQGYEMSTEKHTFTVDASNAGSVQTIQVSDEKIKGSVALTKMDEATKAKKLPDAQFNLYKNDGSLVKEGLTTDGNGTITVTDLEWGSYYFEEIKAPAGYGISRDKVRFSVNEANCTTTQALTCYDPAEQVQITIRKEINEWYEPFGNATFLFEITGTDVNGTAHTWNKSITLVNGATTGSTILSGIPAGTYAIRERGTERYKLDSVTAGANVTVSGDTATAVLTSEKEAEVTFANSISQYEKFSHTGNATNVVNAKTKLTGLQVTYKGPAMIESETENSYTFTADDVEAVAFYDDGSSKAIAFSDLELDPATVTGNNNSSGAGYTVNVSYTENGMTASGSFSVEVNLQIPPQPFTVTYDANGGYFGEDTSSTLNQVTYVMGDKVHITKIAKTDNVGEDGTQTSGSYGNNVAKNQVITIPGAKSLKVSITYQTESTSYDWVCLYEGLDVAPTQGNYSQSQSGKLGGTTKTTKEFTIQGDTVQIFFRSDGSGSNYYGFYAMVEGEGIGNTIAAGEEKQPDHAAKKFVGWYTDAACSDGNEFTLKDCTESTIVYAKWKDPTAVLLNSDEKTGLSKKFADVAETPTAITAFQRSAVMPDASVMDEAHCISTDGSEVPVYLWKDGTTLKWWSKAVKPEAQSLGFLYRSYSNLTDISGLSDWGTSKVTYMGYMFSGCNSLTDLTPLSSWDTSNATNMWVMFQDCSSLTNLTPLSSWDTSNVTRMSSMFDGCKSLTDLTALSNWDTSKVASTNYMFSGCKSLTDLTPLSGWSTIKVTDMCAMFRSCSGLTNLTALSGWDTSKVTYMDYMFYCCNSLTDLTALSGWDTSKVTNMSDMFSGCDSLTNLTALSGWDTSKVTYMSYMFSSCNSLTDLTALSGWDTSNVADMHYMFDGCNSLTNLTALSGWNTSKVTNMNYMFYGCKSLTDLTALSGWDTSNVADMHYMFYGCNSLTDLTALSGWNTSKVTNMANIFAGCNSLTDLTPLSGWNTSKVTNMSDMFSGCSSLTDLSGLSSWDTSKVTSMQYMLSGCKSLTDLTALSSWDTSNVVSMQYMFQRCSSLTDLTALSSWDTSKVTSMYFMFHNCSSLTNSSAINNWDILKVTSFDRMFYQSPSHPTFTKRVGTWDNRGTFTPTS